MITALWNLQLSDLGAISRQFYKISRVCRASMTLPLMLFISPVAAVVVLWALPFLLQCLVQKNLGLRSQPFKHRNGPKAYPLVRAMLEHLWHWDNIHDWLTSYYKKYHTWDAPMHLNKINTVTDRARKVTRKGPPKSGISRKITPENIIFPKMCHLHH
jgi:hypothetical protein